LLSRISIISIISIKDQVLLSSLYDAPDKKIHIFGKKSSLQGYIPLLRGFFTTLLGVFCDKFFLILGIICEFQLKHILLEDSP